MLWPTTPAQYFHLLRRQQTRPYRKPAVVVGPKTLIRLPAAQSPLEDFAPGTGFHSVLPDPAIADGEAERIVFCSGKVYYDLVKQRVEGDKTALVRVEELSPFPGEAIEAAIAAHPNATSHVWAQEEQQNSGAWAYMEPRFRRLDGAKPLEYRGRGALATPAVGSSQRHKVEQKAFLESVFPNSCG